MAKIRKFRHVEGFGDGTDYLEVSDEGSVTVTHEGVREAAPHYTLEVCLGHMENGSFYEMEGTDTLQSAGGVFDDSNSVLEIPLGHGRVAVGVGHNVEDGAIIISFSQQEFHPVGSSVKGSATNPIPIRDELVRFRIDDIEGARSVLREWIKLVPDTVLVDRENLLAMEWAATDLDSGKPCCPECLELKQDGHHPECWLDAALQTQQKSYFHTY